MSILHTEVTSPSPLYAVIDLGSNSFHMLITRQLADSVQVVDKVKRKVRLASGLDKNNILSQRAMARGLECLSFFAERLQDIPKSNIRIVATATLRLAVNRNEFLEQANAILTNTINLLSGEQEAQYIYQGVAYTSCSAEQRLVLDIGGASTEIIVGSGLIAKKIVSLDLGCVTFNRLYFNDDTLNNANFNSAIKAATAIISPYKKSYKDIGWQTVLGGSGTMQALAEVLMFERRPTIITLDFLYDIKHQLIAAKTIQNIQINGLTSERTPVIASGLSILIALFQCLGLKELQLSSGALREGLLYEMLPRNTEISIQQQTINSLMRRFHVDCHHAGNVKNQAIELFNSFANIWQLQKDNSYQILLASCQLHEIGLLLEFKQHQKHSAYIIENAELPGFEQSERQILKAFVHLYKGDIDHKVLKQLTISYTTASYLLAILRLAVILCRRRKDEVVPKYIASINKNEITLCLSSSWIENHPLIADELIQENNFLKAISLKLNTQCQI